MTVWAHFIHVDGIAGDVDREMIVGPFEGVQLTYQWIRETGHGETIAGISEDSLWRLAPDHDRLPLSEPPVIVHANWSDEPEGDTFSDVTFSEERPPSVLTHEEAL